MSHYEDEAQVAELKKWWQENWIALAAGLVIGLGAIFGWQGWQRHQATQAQEASRLFEESKQALAQNKPADAAPIADKLVAEYAKTPYAAAAALQLAAAQVEAGEFDAAAARLDWVLKHSADAGLKPLARLRLARVQWAQGKTDDALKQLDGDTGSYGPLFDELRGDIHLAKGERDAARTAYQKAFDAAGDNRASQESLQRKLDDVATAS